MSIFFQGTDSDNRLAVSFAQDSFAVPAYMYGYGGNDELRGGFLSLNYIYGGIGNDTIRGGATGNWLYGDEGNDTLSCEAGPLGSRLYGGSGDDVLTSNTNVRHGALLDGGAGNDTLRGGDGADTYVVDSVLDKVIETYVPYFENDFNPFDTVESSISWELGLNLEALLLTGNFAINGGGNSLGNVLEGNSAANALFGKAGNDYLKGGGGNDFLDGGDGIDTASFSGAKTGFSVTKTLNGYEIGDDTGLDGIDNLFSIERLRFNDTTVALDINGNAGKAYRLYQAAFDRKPDLPGLGVQINALDRGASIDQISQNFIGSAEFKSLYGDNLSNANLIAKLYNNVLHRAPEQAGFDHWMNVLGTNQLSRSQVLYYFSESDENQAQVIAQIQNGIDYISPV